MKSFQVIFATAFFALAVFTSCQKDGDEPTPQAFKWTKIQLMGDVEQGKCIPGYGLCLQAPQPTDPNDANNLPWATDQLTAEPTLSADGSVLFSGTTSIEHLSAEARQTFLESGRMVFKNTFTLDEAIVRQAYANARVPYSNQTVVVEKGVYDAQRTEVIDATGQLITVEICVSGKGWSVCITFKF